MISLDITFGQLYDLLNSYHYHYYHVLHVHLILMISHFEREEEGEKNVMFLSFG